VSGGQTYVLTADHVCSHPAQSSFEMPFPGGIGKPPMLTRITVDQSTVIAAVDGDGVPHISVVHATDNINDACLIKSDGGWGEGRVVPVALSMPIMGARVYNIGAPFGIFSPGNPGVKLHFEGRYSGSDATGNYFYTLPARPGSSGSAVLDSRGYIIGVVHSAMVNFEHVALASSLSSVHALMSTIPEETHEGHPHRMGAHFFFFGF